VLLLRRGGTLDILEGLSAVSLPATWKSRRLQHYRGRSPTQDLCLTGPVGAEQGYSKMLKPKVLHLLVRVAGGGQALANSSLLTGFWAF